MDLSLPDNSPWIEVAAAAEFPFALRVVPPRTDSPQRLAFRQVPDDEEGMVQLFYETNRDNVIIPVRSHLRLIYMDLHCGMWHTKAGGWWPHNDRYQLFMERAQSCV